MKKLTHRVKNVSQKVKISKNSPNRWQIGALLVVFVVVGTKLLISSFALANSMYLVSSSTTVSLGSTFTAVIHEDSGTDGANAAEADLVYDQTKLQYISTTLNSAVFGLTFANTGGSGKVKVALAKSNTNVTGDQTLATVTFKAIGTGSTVVSFNTVSPDKSQIVRQSDNTNILSATTPTTYTINDTAAPSVPTGLTAGTRTVSSVSFSWTASTDNVAVTGYKVYKGGTLLNGNVATNSFTDTGLNPNTTGSYTVAAFDAAGNTSAQSSALSITTLADTTAPSVPTGLTIGTRTVNTIALSWTASTDNVAVTTYKIYRSGTQVGTSSSTSFTDTALTPNTSYTYTVAAADGSGNTSAQTAGVATGTLADTVAPSAPTGLTSTARTTNSVSLSWTASTDNVAVTGYKVFRDGVQVGTSASATYKDTGLVQATSYNYTVSAYDAAGNDSAATAGLSVSTISKAGDANSDGIVNILDLSIVASNFGLSGQTLSTGDLNGDGTVNILDASILATNWGL